MAHVFISHAAADRAAASAVCAGLEARRIHCWIAPRDVPPGREYAEAIVEAIAASYAVVLLFSSKANASHHVRRELERAVDHQTPIVPFRIEDVMPTGSLEYYVSQYQWLDAVNPPLQRHIDRLGDALGDLPTRPSSAAQQPGQTAVTEPPRFIETPSVLVGKDDYRIQKIGYRMWQWTGVLGVPTDEARRLAFEALASLGVRNLEDEGLTLRATTSVGIATLLTWGAEKVVVTLREEGRATTRIVVTSEWIISNLVDPFQKNKRNILHVIGTLQRSGHLRISD